MDAAFEEVPTPHRAARTAEDRVGVRLGPPIFLEGYVPRQGEHLDLLEDRDLLVPFSLRVEEAS